MDVCMYVCVCVCVYVCTNYIKYVYYIIYVLVVSISIQKSGQGKTRSYFKDPHSTSLTATRFCHQNPSSTGLGGLFDQVNEARPFLQEENYMDTDF